MGIWTNAAANFNPGTNIARRPLCLVPLYDRGCWIGVGAPNTSSSLSSFRPSIEIRKPSPNLGGLSFLIFLRKRFRDFSVCVSRSLCRCEHSHIRIKNEKYVACVCVMEREGVRERGERPKLKIGCLLSQETTNTVRKEPCSPSGLSFPQSTHSPKKTPPKR